MSRRDTYVCNIIWLNHDMLVNVLNVSQSPLPFLSLRVFWYSAVFVQQEDYLRPSKKNGEEKKLQSIKKNNKNKVRWQTLFRKETKENIELVLKEGTPSKSRLSPCLRCAHLVRLELKVGYEKVSLDMRI